jgi:hypothetical protein
MADDPADIGQRPGSPDDGHRSVRLGRRRVELALGEPQQPRANLLVRHGARIGIGLGDRGGQGPRFGLVIFDARCGLGRGLTIGYCGAVL